MIDSKMVSDAYIEELNNRDVILNKFHIKKINFKKNIYYFLLVTVKTLGSFFIMKGRKIDDEKVYLSWGELHSTLSHNVPREFKLIEFNYRSLGVQEMKFYKKISYIKSIKLAYSLFQKGKGYKFNSLLYAISFSIDFQVFNNLLKDVKQLYIAGQLDRYTIISSFICNNASKKLSIVQHGVNNIYDGLYKIKTEEIFYLYDFSIPYFKTYVEDSKDLKFIKIERSLNYDKYAINHNLKKSIAFACQDINPQNNNIIIEELIRKCKDYTIVIYPHPNENPNYYNMYKSNERVVISQNKFKNINLLITRFSTLGVEYNELGVNVVFVNIDDIQSDFLISGKFKVFFKFEDFSKWIEFFNG